MNYLLCIIIGYVIGSFPTAYILLKKLKGIDITKNGSGNVGAFNSYNVSESKLIGLLVFVIDLLKGLLSVYLVREFIGNDFIFPAVSLTAAVFSHCFSPWIKFRGGRGLATAAGGVILLQPLLIGLWVILWIIAFIFRKNIHLANIMATILSLALIFSTSHIFVKYTLLPVYSITEYLIPTGLVLLMILIKHWKPLLEWFGKQKKEFRGNINE